MTWMIRVGLLWALLGLPLCLWADTPAPGCDIECLRDLPYAVVGRETLTLSIIRPLAAEMALPVVLAIHGGSWMRDRQEQMRAAAERLAEHGFAVAVVEYRLAPAHAFPAQWDDVCQAARWVNDHAETYGFDPHRIFVMGVSAGGQLAALLAVQAREHVPKFAGAIIISGPMDLTAPLPNTTARRILRGYLGADQRQRPDLYAKASPITYVTPEAPPFLLVHGTKDPLVPYDQATRMTRALREARVPVTLVPIDMGHPALSETAAEREQILAAVLQFLEPFRADAASLPGK